MKGPSSVRKAIKAVCVRVRVCAPHRAQTWPPNVSPLVKKIPSYKLKRSPPDFHFLLGGTLEANEILEHRQ